MIGTKRNGGAAVADDSAGAAADGTPVRPKKVALPPTRLILPVIVLCLGLSGEFILPTHLTYAASTALCYGLVGLGLYLPLAALRELPLNGAALAGLSAYLFAYNASGGSAGKTVIGIVIGVGVCTLVSVAGGLASLVVTGLYFTVASLVVQIGIEKVVFSVGKLTGGAAGRGVAQPDFTGYFNTNRVVFLIAGVVCLTITTAVWRTKKTKTLSNWVMTGHQPEGADAVGIRRWVQKVVIFGLSGLLIGVAGVLFAFVNGTPPPPPQFGVIWSVIFLAIPIASGLRTISSLWFVAACFSALPIVLESHHINPNLLSGSILLVALMASQSQDAIMARIRNLRRQPETIEEIALAEGQAALAEIHEKPVLATAPAVVKEVDLRSPKVGRALVGTDIGVTFGGVKAVDGVNVRVGPGQRVAIVGANGAGKTTLFNALTGFVPPTKGTVHLGDVDITGVPAYARIRQGLGRTFQLPRLADILTVRQNVLAGQAQGEDLIPRAEWLMERFGIMALADIPIQVVPFGTRRKVEMVRSLARRPEVLLIDEPVSGLEDEEVSELLEVMLELQAAEGWGLLAIEHDLRFVTGIAEQMMVMVDGKVLTEGSITDVLADERVRQVYLGEVVSV
ncbi:MAG: branched-chain amino acid transport system ATP-binding protein livF [Actinomycetota bacterium]|jgi:ABC-type branched-subunit amino acid transport system ATPase component/ABC-type branched-subunit amino acid transport system permease subunit|nr:branched-chain amino acid transport system ATP-binding protein livF [Actinomycetota bacterium]